MERLDDLATLIDRFSGSDGVHPTAVPRLFLIRSEHATEPLHALHEPAVCIIASGRKQVILGDRVYDYDRSRYLVVSVDVPVIGQVTEASRDAPYLCFRLDLDPGLLTSLMIETGHGSVPGDPPAPGIVLGTPTADLMDAAARLVGLLGSPQDIPVLAPLIEREILYRLMTGDQGSRLRQIALAESKLQQVNRAIGWIKRNFRDSFSIEAVAEEARMSPSALHQHFKAVTAMSPLQYQKQLRLQEARRLMLARAIDAASAAFDVGYESPSQFSREYRRLFGAPPMRDVARLRTASGIFGA